MFIAYKCMFYKFNTRIYHVYIQFYYVCYIFLSTFPLFCFLKDDI